MKAKIGMDDILRCDTTDLVTNKVPRTSCQGVENALPCLDRWLLYTGTPLHGCHVVHDIDFILLLFFLIFQVI